MTDKKATVLIVDDEPMNIAILMDLLKSDYRLLAAKDGQQAVQRVKSSPPDLILLDIMMPNMNGYEVCESLKADPAVADIPIIFVTAMGEVGDEKKGFDLGAVDYIVKPISPPIVKARVATQLALVNARRKLLNQNAMLEEKVKERTKEVEQIKDITIFCMATLAETRDNETGNHIRRTQNYVKALAEELYESTHYRDQLSPHRIELLYKSAPLHDIGKVGIPDHILLKPGRLDEAEFTIMKTHAELGAEAIRKAELELFGERSDLESENNFLHYAREIAGGHHEKWDGSGYPAGLKGEEIPLSARLMAVADVYDALISERVYKPAFEHQTAIQLITEGRGTHFDPTIVDSFVKIAGEFAQIAEKFRDEH